MEVDVTLASGKKGYQATHSLSQRNRTQRGGNAPDGLLAGDPGRLARHAADYLEFLAVRNYTPDTIEGPTTGRQQSRLSGPTGVPDC